MIPASGIPAGTATTQPMVMPRGVSGLKPARPGMAQSSRSTQRIVLPTSPSGGKATNTKALSVSAPTGRISLPIGMILRCLPAEVLASDMSEFEASGAAATEIGLPMNMILSQLPSGKVEVPLQELVPHFPAGYLQPTESIVSYLPTLISLPLMDVVMRIPPDLLALRPDQKGVDAAVINMADPFTEEILREQAEAARRQAAQANIIDESQVPQAEEFVPQPPTPKTIAPPPRPPSAALPLPRGQAAGAVPPTIPGAVPPSATTTSSVSARTIPTPSVSASGRLPTPTRATSAIPSRPPAPSAPPLTSAAPPTPPVSRHTTSLPVPPVPRQTGAVSTPGRQHTTSIQMPPRPSSTLAPPMGSTVPLPSLAPPAPIPIAAQPPIVLPPTPPVPPAEVVSGQADAGAGDLQRLAALAMQQMGEDTSTKETAPLPVSEPAAALEPPPAPVPQPVVTRMPVPAPAPLGAPPTPRFIPASAVTEEATVMAIPAPAPEPVAPSPAPEPVVAAPAPEPVVAAPSINLEEFVVRPSAAEVAKTPTASLPFVPAAVAAPEPEIAPAPPSAGVAFNLNTCTIHELVQIPGCFRDLAESIIAHRQKIGSFKRLEDLLDVPGMTKDAYTNLTGEAPPENRIPLSLNELLGFPSDQYLSLKDVTERIACWPDVTGCVLSQSSGLSLVGNVPQGLDKAAIVAFAPRMFEAINKSFSEITGRETDELAIPIPGTSFHIFRNKDLYLIILCRLPQMPERHMKVARFVLAALSIRRD
ncbi:MAG: helix-hairpin-helix domain-containing protein [Methylacidiphilales bacterium]|nr:helix-hairpin-helix domain-containing protein [Candidatus Methylacidiphilales bacterium]